MHFNQCTHTHIKLQIQYRVNDKVNADRDHAIFSKEAENKVRDSGGLQKNCRVNVECNTVRRYPLPRPIRVFRDRNS